ncbi:MAG: LysE family transporter [Chloroflexi bacterium]|nr:LysE family transporter [Chloroflexota bacterium]
MDLPFLFRGLAVGFAIAAAVGPISLLTLRRTIVHGRLYGLVSGLGVAAADASYGAVAAFGLTALTSILVGAATALGLIGGAVLIWLGIRSIRAHPVATANPDPSGSAAPTRPRLPGAFLSIYGLTMTNPMTILSFGAIFAGLGLAGRGGLEATLLTLGVFLGSSLWWVLLTAIVGRVRDRITPTVLTWINRASGAALVVFGAVAIVHAVGSAASAV